MDLAGLHQRSVEEVAALLGSDRRRGLSAREAARRLEIHGGNVLPAPRRRGPWRRLALQFHSPLVYVLIAAAAITAALGQTIDSAVIAGVVAINAAIGFAQESRSERALQALVSVATTRAVVVRDGRRHEVDSAELVPGDLIRVEAGDRVPTDMRLCWVRELSVDESMLTGESIPSAKQPRPLPSATIVAERSNTAFAGTLVTTGSAEGVAVATGADTELGRIHRLVGEATDLATPLTRRIGEFSRFLTVLILGLAAATFLLGLARGETASDMVTAAAALAVGAIPEGLPAAVTITLAIGVSRMARRRAIVRRLPAAETLGSTTVICSDKTGTLTQNRMVVRAIWAGGVRYGVAGEGYAPEGTIDRDDGVEEPLAEPARACLVAGALCNDARLLRGEGGEGWTVVGDPTEGALLAAAERADLDIRDLRTRHRRLDVLPFDAERGWMATLDAMPAGPTLHVKGAVERVLERSVSMLDAEGSIPLDHDLVLARAQELAAEGLRVLAVAKVTMPDASRIAEDRVGRLTLLGLQCMLDPPRAEAVAAVEECRRAGIAVKMVTGDQLETAAAIARRIALVEGREPSVMSGSQIAEEDPRDLPEVVDGTDVFARVSPEQKLWLVEALQARGHVVAMTGDGVNDAPALRQADLGIAMGQGTEVAKESADMVLADDNFATLAGAVEEGRRIFDNLTKFIVWTLPTNVAEGMVVLTAILLGITLPILPTQILWINMTTAVALGLPLAFERLEAQAMRRPPRDPGQPLLTGALIERLFLVSALLLGGAFGLFELELHLGASVEEARTVAVNTFVVGQAFYLLNCRSLTRSFLSLGLFSNRWVAVGIATMALLQAGFTYLPAMQRLFETRAVSLESWGRILAVGLVILAVVGAEKLLRQRRSSGAGA